MKGVLRKIIAGFCYVEAGDKVYECKPRGNMRRNGGNILAGDIVEFTVLENGKGVVENIEKRKNSLVRPPVANINYLFIVSSQNIPSPNALLIDRLTAIAESKGIEPVIVFNKSDMGDLEEWYKIYSSSGFKTFVVSAKTGEGIEEFKNFVYECSGVSVFTGNSGVGKSTLLNYIFPNLKLDTGEVSEKLGRGRHTTRKVELFKTLNGYVADTPGFSSMDLERCEIILKDDLASQFKDFEKFIYDCKFSSCSHTGEKGCALGQAVENGEVNISRYNSYKALYNEIKDIKEWELKAKK